MAKASVVSAQQHKQLEDINAKLDLLLKNAGLTFEGTEAGEAPKPIKTFIKPAVVPSAPQAEPEVEEPATSKHASKKKNG